ncbi:MAG: hypothetical protein JNJ83_18060 [Verrucomicrobiaceae bacterium]|nr:hypothetical protein [Verrucomicrobiaceae bacterium]
MPFDPTYPPASAEIESAPLRDQFNALNDDIQTRATAAALVAAIDGTSANSNSVATISMNADPDYNQSQMQAVLQKLDELILILRR